MKRLITYIIVLLVLGSCIGGGKYTAMRKGLDSINMFNRNGQPFTIADVEPYVRFFDNHGTPNDQLLAHYLLGRAYYDHGEAPMAMKYYQEATELADTTNADCDYAQLSRVYAQMARVFYDQGLYRHDLYHVQKAERYAWLGADTLAALKNYEQRGTTYARMGHTDSLIFVIKEVVKKYERYGYPTDAVIALGPLIDVLVKRGEYTEAKNIIDNYESKSGRFDSLGNIESGREIYYRLKGLYYLHTNHLDSAEYYFRKELRDGKDFNNQDAGAKGLAELYQKLNKPDSVVKYYQYAYAMNDSLHTNRTAKDVERIKAMYDYSRYQETAHQESEKAILANKRLFVCLFVLLVIILLTSWLFFARKEIETNYKKAIQELGTINAENEELRKDALTNMLQITENEKRISQLKKKLGRYGKLVYFGSEKIENDLMLSPNYQRIKEIAYRGKTIQESEWNIIRQLINEYFPECDDFLKSKLEVNSVEHQVCSLLRLHFKTGEIANMLNVTPPYISKVSTEIMKNLFKKKGSSKELAKELKVL